MLRQTGRDLAALDERPWNAHPPVAVLVALPFGLIPDYRAAHLVWNLVTFPLFLVGVGLIIRELRILLHAWSIFPAIVFLVASNPVISQLWHAQLNFPLLFLFAVAWAAERRSYRAGAGIAVGIATAIKLFPGLLLVYFVAARGWRQAAFTILAAVSANAVALGLFGWEAFATYIQVVLPSLEVFRGSWGNASLTGYATRVLQAAAAPTLIPVVVYTLQIAVVATIGLVAWRAVTPDARDRAFAIAIAGMPLASPIAWPYNFVLLALPLLLLWQRLALT
jgi:glycosyl transferase family 87